MGEENKIRKASVTKERGEDMRDTTREREMENTTVRSSSEYVTLHWRRSAIICVLGWTSAPVRTGAVETCHLLCE